MNADDKTEREFEQWQDGKEITPLKGVDLRAQLLEMWKSYTRQKSHEADAGRDTSLDIARMREVFRLASRGELDERYIERHYPDKLPDVMGDCPTCCGEGWYFSHASEFKYAYGTRVAPAYVLCKCPWGVAKRDAIKALGRSKRKAWNG